MDYVEGDCLDLVIDGSYEYTIIIGKSKKGKRNLLSIESDLIELKSSSRTLGWFIEKEIDDLLDIHNGVLRKVVTPPPVNDGWTPNWNFFNNVFYGI